MSRLRCWRCAKEQAPAFFCASCEAVQGPPADADYFALLGLPPHPEVDEAMLSERYYALSRRLHPDRFHNASARERAESVRATAVLNGAFQTLRDLEGRGRYWLARSGDPLGREDNRVAPELAGFVFEVQEKLGDAKAAPPDARRAAGEEIARAGRDVAERRAERREQLSALLREWPANGRAAGEGADLAPRRRRLKDLLAELSYLRTLERDVRAALEE